MGATVVLDQQQRNGTFTSGSVDIPDAEAVNPDTGVAYENVVIYCPMGLPDIQNADSQARLTAEVSYDGNEFSTWQVVDWKGGPLDKHGEPNTKAPGFGGTIPELGGVRAVKARAVLDTQGHTLNFGITIDVQ